MTHNTTWTAPAHSIRVAPQEHVMVMRSYALDKSWTRKVTARRPSCANLLYCRPKENECTYVTQHHHPDMMRTTTLLDARLIIPRTNPDFLPEPFLKNANRFSLCSICFHHLRHNLRTDRPENPENIEQETKRQRREVRSGWCCHLLVIIVTMVQSLCTWCLLPRTFHCQRKL